MSNPYNLEKSGDGYLFTTEADITYFAYFDPYEYFFNHYPLISFYLFTFNFEIKNLNGFRKPPKDEGGRIKDTIAKLMEGFFKEDEERALIIICDSADKRHKSRNKMFNDLFLNNNNGLFLEKHNGYNAGVVENEDGEKELMEVYSSIILSQNHMFKDELIQAYHEVRTGFFNKTELE